MWAMVLRCLPRTQFLKPIFASLTPYIKFNFVLAAGVAGGLASIALCPAEEVRIRQVCPTPLSSRIATNG